MSANDFCLGPKGPGRVGKPDLSLDFREYWQPEQRMSDKPSQGDEPNNAEEQSQDGSDSAAPGYGNGPGYWNARYEKDAEPFEWLESWSDLRAMMEEVMENSLSSRILHVGCGNSIIAEQMYDHGYRDILNIDTSSVVIRQMASRSKDRTGMCYEVMDATDMNTLADGSFDLVLDKSVLDTFACTDSALYTISKYLNEITRVLRPGGTFFCVSYGSPWTRTSFFELPHLDWSMRQIEIPPKGDGQPHWVYICQVPDKAEGRTIMPWSEVERSLKFPVLPRQ